MTEAKGPAPVTIPVANDGPDTTTTGSATGEVSADLVTLELIYQDGKPILKAATGGNAVVAEIPLVGADGEPVASFRFAALPQTPDFVVADDIVSRPRSADYNTVLPHVTFSDQHLPWIS
ncbi:hypothetical protein AB0I30_08330 [Nocardia tengchongensis]|uniref:hypothetical protein n=1 Tax=Nocardia tengchongensis TaxID=2055889 RepID=UPI003410BDEF